MRGLRRSSGTISSFSDRSPRFSRGEFYPPDSPSSGFLQTLATFAVGFAVRPLGALFFGRVGDRLGRKSAFLTTLLLMGGSTAAIGLLPGYRTIGFVAPLALVRATAVAGIGARWRVRRRGGIRGGAFARETARILHELHIQHRHARTAAVAHGDTGDAKMDRRDVIRVVGLARPVHSFRGARRGFVHRSAQACRVAGVHGAQGARRDFGSAGARYVRRLALAVSSSRCCSECSRATR